MQRVLKKKQIIIGRDRGNSNVIIPQGFLDPLAQLLGWGYEVMTTPHHCSSLQVRTPEIQSSNLAQDSTLEFGQAGRSSRGVITFAGVFTILRTLPSPNILFITRLRFRSKYGIDHVPS